MSRYLFVALTLIAACRAPPSAPTTIEPATTGFVLAGERHPVADVTIVTMADEGGFDAVAANQAALAEDTDDSFEVSYGPRHVDGRALAPHEVAAQPEVVWRVVLKTDLSGDSAGGFRSAVGRSFAEHFYVDFDGVVFQALDLALAGRRFVGEGRAAGHDHELIIVLNNRMPNLEREDEPPYPPVHKRSADHARHPRLRSEPLAINGKRFVSYGYTDAQYHALSRLLTALAKVFPAIAVGPPRDATGAVPTAVLPEWQTLRGVLADWHTFEQRWSPGPGFDWSRLPFAAP